jgi:hypothetical protein
MDCQSYGLLWVYALNHYREVIAETWVGGPDFTRW